MGSCFSIKSRLSRRALAQPPPPSHSSSSSSSATTQQDVWVTTKLKTMKIANPDLQQNTLNEQKELLNSIWNQMTTAERRKLGAVEVNKLEQLEHYCKQEARDMVRGVRGDMKSQEVRGYPKEVKEEQEEGKAGYNSTSNPQDLTDNMKSDIPTHQSSSSNSESIRSVRFDVGGSETETRAETRAKTQQSREGGENLFLGDSDISERHNQSLHLAGQNIEHTVTISSHMDVTSHVDVEESLTLSQMIKQEVEMTIAADIDADDDIFSLEKLKLGDLERNEEIVIKEDNCKGLEKTKLKPKLKREFTWQDML